MKVKLVKLFTKIDYEGYVTPPAIISYGRACIEWKSEDMGRGMCRTVVSKYRHDLEINIWLLIFRFQWTSSPTVVREH